MAIRASGDCAVQCVAVQCCGREATRQPRRLRCGIPSRVDCECSERVHIFAFPLLVSLASAPLFVCRVCVCRCAVQCSAVAVAAESASPLSLSLLPVPLPSPPHATLQRGKCSEQRHEQTHRTHINERVDDGDTKRRRTQRRAEAGRIGEEAALAPSRAFADKSFKRMQWTNKKRNRVEIDTVQRWQ